MYFQVVADNWKCRWISFCLLQEWTRCVSLICWHISIVPFVSCHFLCTRRCMFANFLICINISYCILSMNVTVWTAHAWYGIGAVPYRKVFIEKYAQKFTYTDFGTTYVVIIRTSLLVMLIYPSLDRSSRINNAWFHKWQHLIKGGTLNFCVTHLFHYFL